MGDEILGSLGQGAPILQAFCQTGEYYREKGDLEKAEAQLREALQLESDHLAARLLLASIFVDHERLDEGLQELEEACRIDEQAARPPMVKALLKKGENLDQAGQDERALHTYERVLRLSPGDGTAHQRIAAIWEKRAAEALQAEDLDLAISAYERAGLADEVAKVKTERRRRAIEQAAAVAQVHEQREDWQEACASYRWLIDEDAQNQSWPLALNRAALEIKLQDRYARAADALQRSEWASAIDLLIEVLTVRPDYKDSASRLAEAVNKTRKGEEKSDAVPQTPSDEAREESSEEQAAELPKTSGPLRASWLLAGAVVAFLCALILGHFLTSPMTDAIALVESTPSSRVPNTSPPGTLNTKAEQSLAFVAEERVLPAENALSTTHAAGRNRPATGAAHPDIWLVEADGPIELYSNGLQIRNEYLTHTGPRFYPVLERDVSGNHHTHRWGDRPVGIVLHSTESDLAAFAPPRRRAPRRSDLLSLAGRQRLEVVFRRIEYYETAYAGVFDQSPGAGGSIAAIYQDRWPAVFQGPQAEASEDLRGHLGERASRSGRRDRDFAAALPQAAGALGLDVQSGLCCGSSCLCTARLAGRTVRPLWSRLPQPFGVPLIWTAVNRSSHDRPVGIGSIDSSAPRVGSYLFDEKRSTTSRSTALVASTASCRKPNTSITQETRCGRTAGIYISS